MTPPELDTLLETLEVAPGDADAPLVLSSLQLVMLIEQIERVDGLVVPNALVTRENFESRRTVLALLARVAGT